MQDSNLSLLSSRPSAAILVSERSDRSRSFRSLCIMLYFSPVELTDMWGTSIKSELRSELKKLLPTSPWVRKITQSPFIDIFYCIKAEADRAQCWREEKKYFKVSISGFIFCHFNYTRQFPCLIIIGYELLLNFGAKFQR